MEIEHTRAVKVWQFYKEKIVPHFRELPTPPERVRNYLARLDEKERDEIEDTLRKEHNIRGAKKLHSYIDLWDGWAKEAGFKDASDEYIARFNHKQNRSDYYNRTRPQVATMLAKHDQIREDYIKSKE